MPRFFFDVHDGVASADETGTELADIAAAKAAAAMFAGGLLKDDPERIWDGDEWMVRVRDENGLALFDLALIAILAPSLRQDALRGASASTGF